MRNERLDPCFNFDNFKKSELQLLEFPRQNGGENERGLQCSKPQHFEPFSNCFCCTNTIEKLEGIFFLHGSHPDLSNLVPFCSGFGSYLSANRIPSFLYVLHSGSSILNCCPPPLIKGCIEGSFYFLFFAASVWLWSLYKGHFSFAGFSPVPDMSSLIRELSYRQTDRQGPRSLYIISF